MEKSLIAGEKNKLLPTKLPFSAEKKQNTVDVLINTVEIYINIVGVLINIAGVLIIVHGIGKKKLGMMDVRSTARWKKIVVYCFVK